MKLFIFCMFFLYLLSGAISENINIELLTENDLEINQNFERDLSQMPESLVFQIFRNQQRAVLRLTKISALNTTVIRKDGIYNIPLNRQDLASYSDYTTKAVLFIKRKDNDLQYTLEGHFQIGLKLLHISPSNDGLTHIIKDEDILAYSTQESIKHQHRSKRSLQTYTLEICFISDYENFFSFFGRNNNNLNLAEAEMRNYFAFIAEKMKVRYHNLNEVDPTIAFDVVISGLIIIEDRPSAWFTENIKDGDLVEAADMLNATQFWYADPPQGVILPSSDHFMFFTGYNLVHAENVGNAGLAYAGVVCKYAKHGLKQSTSIVEDHRDGETGVTASHELGHALSAQHDSNVGCKDSDAYIMSGQAVIITNIAKARRPWEFSTCSVQAIKTFVERSDVNCLNDNRYGDGVVTSSERAGQYFNVNEQCAMKFGEGSTMCDFAYRSDKDKLCYLLFCSVTTSSYCTSARVMEYTDCDVNKWCHRGLCIKANNTEPIFVNLPQGIIELNPAIGGVIYRIRIFDPDIEDVLNLHLTWSPAEVADYFSFNESSREISVKPDKSLETLASTSTNFSLIMSVDDGLLRSLPSNIDFQLVEPQIHPPRFTNTTYYITVNEGKAGDIVIDSLLNSVTDPDGTNPIFSLQEIDFSYRFIIDSNTGRITYRSDYDYDPVRLPNSVALVVDATDPTNLTATATINLNILNVDQPTVIQNLPNNVNLPENTLPDTLVFTVNAVDPDSSDVLRYSFSNPSLFVQTYLTMNENNGEIRFSGKLGSLDFESLESRQMVTTVEVSTDFGSVSSSLTVTVSNINEPPEFSLSSYAITTTSGGTQKVILQTMTDLAYDPDAGDRIVQFLILPGPFSNLFKIDEATGRLNFAVQYTSDREIHPENVYLRVQAKDTQAQTAIAYFNITVTISQRAPFIRNLPGQVTLNENSPADTVVFRVDAYDVNQEDSISYSLTFVTGIPGMFVINADGVVTVNTGATVDFESITNPILVSVTASDGKDVSYPATLTVNIKDINEPPKFTQPVYSIVVDEGDGGKVLVPSLLESVIDPDSQTVLTFSIVPSKYSTHFNVNSSTGQITLNGDYDTDPNRLPEQVDIFLIVRDEDLLFGEADFKFTINNINRGPAFLNVPYPVRISTQLADNTVIYTIRVYDRDTTDILTVTSELESPTNPKNDFFNFNSTSREVLFKNGAQFTGNRTFYINFTVSDGQLSSTGNLIVIVVYTVQSTSSPVPSTSTTPRPLRIRNLPSSISIDENSDDFVFQVETNTLNISSLQFQLVQENQDVQELLFTINDVGGISVASNVILDYENLPSTIYLQITATDETGTSASARLNITIVDVNEPPIFNQTKYTFSLTEAQLQINTVLIESLLPFVNDPDKDETFTFAFAPSNQSSYFTIDEANGKISLNSNYDPIQQPNPVTLTVVMRDSESAFIPIPISLNIITDNRPPQFTNLPSSMVLFSNTSEGSIVFTPQSVDPNKQDNLTTTVTFNPVVLSQYFIINKPDAVISLADRSVFSTNQTVTLQFTVTDGQESVSAELIISIIVITPISTSTTTEKTETTSTTSTTRQEITSTTVQDTTPTITQDKTSTPTPSEPINIINLPNTIQIVENTPGGTPIYNILTNKDAVNGFNVKSSLAAPFQITSDGAVFVSPGATLDFETISSPFTLLISAVLLNQTSIEKALTIEILNVNEAPIFSQPSYNFTITSGEVGTVIVENLTPYVNDPDQGETFSFELLSGGELVNINPNTGKISLNKEYDNDDQFTVITVLVKDSSNMANASDSTTIFLTVQPSNRSPSFINLPATIVVDPDSDINIFTVQITDPNNGDILKVTTDLETTIANTFFFYNTREKSLQLKNSTVFNQNGVFNVRFTVTDGKLSKNADLTIRVFKESQTSTTVRSLPPSDDEELFKRPWVIAVLSVTALIVFSLVTLVVCIICRRKAAEDKSSLSSEQLYDDKPQDQIIRPAYHQGYFSNPGYVQTDEFDQIEDIEKIQQK